jgi:hypothetical protein
LANTMMYIKIQKILRYILSRFAISNLLLVCKSKIWHFHLNKCEKIIFLLSMWKMIDWIRGHKFSPRDIKRKDINLFVQKGTLCGLSLGDHCTQILLNPKDVERKNIHYPSFCYSPLMYVNIKPYINWLFG